VADNTAIVRYYRADAPAVRDAWTTYQAECAAVVGEAKGFASLFEGATPVFASGLHGRRFHGLTFDPPMPTDVWTHPDRKQGNVQRPRAKIVDKTARKNPERVEALSDATSLYMVNKPTSKADIDRVFTALGADWGIMLFGGFAAFEREGVMFVRTLAQLGGPCVEITGGEYESAHRMEKARG
jgi:hypothetical protein